jgi:hypothetical protein
MINQRTMAANIKKNRLIISFVYVLPEIRSADVDDIFYDLLGCLAADS